MINIDIQSTYCVISDENNRSARKLEFKGSDQTGINKRRVSHKWFDDGKWRVDVFYNNDGSINKALLFLISDKIHLKLKQENLYKKNHLRKITHYDPDGYDIYIFKNDLIIEEWMVIYSEEVEFNFKLLQDWIHTRKFYDYKNKLIKIYSYDQFNNRIYKYDKVEKMF